MHEMMSPHVTVRAATTISVVGERLSERSSRRERKCEGMLVGQETNRKGDPGEL